MEKNDKEKLEQYEKLNKTQKNVAKLWVIVFAVLVVIAIVFSIVSRL